MSDTEIITGATAVRDCNADRIVQRWFNDGECFERYVIRSRERVIARLRQLRSWGYDRKLAYRIVMNEGLKSQHYGGPGRSYIRGGGIYKINRRWVVLRQAGGLDI
jgi:hypothetical protein